MFSFLSFIGVVLLLALAAFYFLKSYVKGPIKSDGSIRPSDKQSPPFLQKLADNKKVYFGLLILALALTLNNWLFFYAYQGNQYYLVYPTGNWTTYYTPGLKWRGFATIQEWQKEFDIKVVGQGESVDGIEGVIKDQTPFIIDIDGKRTEKEEAGIHITFVDRVNAAVRISTRMRMPQHPDAFRVLAESFKTQENLINNTLIPTVREQLSNVGYQYTAQDYTGGAATDFRQAIDDQLKFGGYSTIRKENHDTIYADIQIAGARTIKEIKTTYEIIRREDGDGKLIRIPHEITKNDVEVTQVIIDAVVTEPAFQRRLEAQRDLSAQKKIEMEKIEVAKAEQQRVVAEGEVAKASERVTQEKQQVGQLIAIETELKQESTKRDKAAIALQTERLEAERVLTRERAQAEANRLKVQAGLTPQERAYWDYRRDSVVSSNVAKIQFPTTYFAGQDQTKGGGGMLETLIGANMANQMLNKKNP